MKLIDMRSIRGRDFSGTLECEHCGVKENLTSGYDDGHYHNRVIPAFHCKACGLNRAGDARSEEVEAHNQSIGVHGV